MGKLTIKTNHAKREVVYWYELTDKERSNFDYLDTEDKQSEATFIRYRGVVYDLGEFSSLRITGTPEFGPWDGYLSDSYFSGVLIKYHDNCETVIMGTFYS